MPEKFYEVDPRVPPNPPSGTFWLSSLVSPWFRQKRGFYIKLNKKNRNLRIKTKGKEISKVTKLPKHSAYTLLITVYPFIQALLAS